MLLRARGGEGDQQGGMDSDCCPLEERRASWGSLREETLALTPTSHLSKEYRHCGLVSFVPNPKPRERQWNFHFKKQREVRWIGEVPRQSLEEVTFPVTSKMTFHLHQILHQINNNIYLQVLTSLLLLQPDSYCLPPPKALPFYKPWVTLTSWSQAPTLLSLLAELIPSAHRCPTATSLWRTPSGYIAGVYLIIINHWHYTPNHYKSFYLAFTFSENSTFSKLIITTHYLVLL